MFRTLLAALFLILFTSYICPQTGLGREETTVISGRVVDSARCPVANATVSLYAVARDKGHAQSVDRVIPFYRTDLDGRFSFSFPLAQDKQVKLYVTTPLPIDAYAPLAPPFLDLAGANLFAGRTVTFGQKTLVDVGDVPVAIHYKPVVVRLQDSSGEAALDTGKGGLPWVRVRNYQGDLISLGAVPEKAVRKEDSSIVLALPEGVWKIECSLKGPNGPWYTHAELVHIDSKDDQVNLTLNRPSVKQDGPQVTGQKEIDRTGFGEARQRLGELGIAYSNDSFISHAGKCNAEVVSLFLATGMSPNVKDSFGTTPLLAAAAQGCDEVTRVLLDRGAAPNLTNEANTSPLLAAVSAGNVATVRILLTYNADPRSKDADGLTPLMVAAGNGRASVVGLLLKAKSEVNAQDKKGMTALDYALQTSDHDVIDLLRMAGAKSGKE